MGLSTLTPSLPGGIAKAKEGSSISPIRLITLLILSARPVAFLAHGFAFRTSNDSLVLSHLQSRSSSPWGPLFYAPAKDASTVKANKDFLMGAFDFNRDRLREIDATSNILTLDVGVLDQRATWLKSRLELKDNEMKKIIQSQPQILAHTNLADKMDWLQRRLGLDDFGLKKVIVGAPHILPCSMEDNIGPTLDWLQWRLGLDDVALRKMILRQPYTLGCSVDENLEPTLKWLQKRFDFDDSTLGKIVQKNPQIMHLSIESNLELKVEWLRQRLGIDGRSEQFRKMIQLYPVILGLSIEDNLEPKLAWIQRSLSLTDDDLTKFILKFPSIFSCNVEKNLEPTMNFYVDALGNQQKARSLLKSTPSLLAYSLETRLKPRLEEIRNAGILVDSLHMRRIGQYTNEQWGKHILKSRKISS
ncbi:hypothetical protein ACHAWF_002302 [Thalassiosira exigua]